MRPLIPRALLLAALLGLPLAAQEGPAPWEQATPPGHFLSPDALDLPAILPSPPAWHSLAGRAELDALLQIQTWRTTEQVAWAKLVEKDTVWQAGALLGEGFTAARLPRTARFFWKLTVDTHAISERAKLCRARPRPPQVDPRLAPCVSLPENTSYPSGHSLQAYVRAEVLSDLFPRHRTALLERAQRAAWSRILGGVHFPTDTVAGRRLAKAIVERLRSLPAYREALEDCRAELAERLPPP